MSDANEPIKVLVTVNFSDDILNQLSAISPRLKIERHYPQVPESAWSDAEIIYSYGGRSLPDPAQAPRVRWIQVHSAGLDGVIGQPIAQAQDVEITSASGIHAVQMAEYCLAMMLAFSQQLPLMFQLKERAEWPKDAYNRFASRDLRGQTLGIAGYGSIGRELARMADALGMVVVATKRNVMQPNDSDEYTEAGVGDPVGEIPERLYPPEALVSMASICDYLVLTVPLTSETRHMVNEAVLKAMKPSAVLINVARGGVVDERALISALAGGTIAGAGLDVFEEEPLPSTSPLWNLDNVIISPHISGSSTRYYEKAAALFAENLQRYLDKRPLLNRLDRDRGY